MSLSNTSASKLLVENLSLLKNLSYDNGALDLACGAGRNGLLLASDNIPVTFADCNGAKLAILAGELRSRSLDGVCWQVDLEATGRDPLEHKRFDLILVFNYLHRPLMASIRQALRPGGLIMYETFTTHQLEFGKPTNPNYLLRPGELLGSFNEWEVELYFEGERHSTQKERRCAKASLIARKPTQE